MKAVPNIKSIKNQQKDRPNNLHSFKRIIIKINKTKTQGGQKKVLPDTKKHDFAKIRFLLRMPWPEILWTWKVNGLRRGGRDEGKSKLFLTGETD